MISHVVSQRLENADAVALVRSTNRKGAPIYAYMRLTKSGVRLLERAIAAGRRVNLSDYGELLFADEGEPDDEIRLFMQEEYGFVDEA